MTLKIYDDIVPDQMKEAHWWMTGTEGVSFTDIDQFIASIPAEDDRIDILLHCCGGSISEGWAMVDKLRATGKTITATIDGQCASMAVCLLLAASERKAYRHAELLIHDPRILDYYNPDATADELQKAADQLRADREKILDFYVERTGADREVLSALMDEEKFIGMERAKELGFIQEIIPDASAMAAARRTAFNQSHNITSMSKDSKAAGLINGLANLLGVRVNIVDEPVNYVLATADGSEITIDIPEGQDPAVGDPASPDGEHAMPDGTTIVIADGAITEIRPAEDSDPDQSQEDVDALRQQIADLTAERDSLQAQVDTLTASQTSDEERDILSRVNAAGGLDWLKKATSSNYVPKPRQTKSENTLSKTEQRLQELRERNK